MVPERSVASMCGRWRILGGLAFLTLVVPGVALSDPGADEVAHNRRLLERWRADPEHYQRLQRDLRAFWALPPERQQQLRALDRQLHDLDPAAQKRLLEALGRYAYWLERLREADPEEYSRLEAV